MTNQGKESCRPRKRAPTKRPPARERRLAKSQTPAELPRRLQPRPTRRNNARKTLDRHPALRPHGIHDHRRPTLGGEVAHLHAVHVALQRTSIVHRVPHQHHLPPPRLPTRPPPP